MSAFLHPGVYVLEVPSGNNVIQAVSTSTLIMVGQTERGPLTPTLLSSRLDYSRFYGGYKRFPYDSNQNLRPTLAYAADQYFKNGGQLAYVLRWIHSPGTSATASRSGPSQPGGRGTTWKINATSPGTWANGTTTAGLFAVTLPSTDGSSSRFRIVVVYTPLDGVLDINGVITDGPKQVVEDWDKLSIDPNDENYVVGVLARSQYITWDSATPPAIPASLDGAAGMAYSDIIASLAVPNFSSGSPGNTGSALTGGAGGDVEADPNKDPLSNTLPLLDDISDASLLSIPATPGDDSTAIAYTNAAIAYVLTRAHQDLFAVGDIPRHNSDPTATQAANDVASTDLPLLTGTNFAAVYYPWVNIPDPAGAGSSPTIFCGPAATVAGIMARTDDQVGVWKAPAGLNAQLLGVNSLEFKIKDVDQNLLNPLGINCLRNMPAGGNVVWGARTLQPNSEWRYVPVRRMAIFLRVSIYNGIQFAVFEPNDEPLWAALRAAIGGFMNGLYRQGAFAGSTPAQAYFVKADSETTTPSDQLAGFVNVFVGFAPLRPAEFVVVRLSQLVAQSS